MRSMTAYASVARGKNIQSVSVVLRSMNFKYLDVAVRNLPSEEILLEEVIKKEVKKRIYRGKIEVFIFLKSEQPQKIYVDRKVIARYVSEGRKLAREFNIDCKLEVSDLLALPKAISCEQKRKSKKSFILAAVKEAVAKLLEFKEKGGATIKREIAGNLDKIKTNLKTIEKQKPKVDKIENGKEDIDEELSLLSFYIKKLESVIKKKTSELKGKSIDFLTQEILRELNAASSKTKKKIPALLIVEAKNYLERIREQAQNIE